MAADSDSGKKIMSEPGFSGLKDLPGSDPVIFISFPWSSAGTFLLDALRPLMILTN